VSHVSVAETSCGMGDDKHATEREGQRGAWSVVCVMT